LYVLLPCWCCCCCCCCSFPCHPTRWIFANAKPFNWSTSLLGFAGFDSQLACLHDYSFFPLHLFSRDIGSSGTIYKRFPSSLRCHIPWAALTSRRRLPTVNFQSFGEGGKLRVSLGRNTLAHFCPPGSTVPTQPSTFSLH
jgi:hypothetical protein